MSVPNPSTDRPAGPPPGGPHGAPGGPGGPAGPGDRGAAPGGGVPFSEIAPLMQLADMMAPNAVRVAATLRLADHIAAGTTKLRDLASTTGTHAGALRRLLRYLTARGVFAEVAPGEYGLTDLAKPLLDDHPAHLRARFDLDGPVGRGDLSFIHLIDTVRSGGPSFQKMYGKPFWEDLNSDPKLVSEFAGMMAANVRDSGIEDEYDWSDVKHVVDVGGGNGALISQVLEAHPHVRGTIVDLPATAERARAAMEEAGLADRCDVVAGSFFDPLPEGADVYLLCKILHDWGDEESLAILKRCREAAGKHGRVLILEMVLTGQENAVPFTYLDLHMLVYFGGKERTLEEFQELGAAAGLDVRLAGKGKWGGSILECVPK